jgi:NAD(P)-dependent dehydrogenase (short-subunit alcohol dehydrogenase family)
VIGDIEAAALKASADDIGAIGVQTDVSDIAQVRALADETLGRFGRIDILCNNAGVGPFGSIEDLTLADWKWILDINLWGVIHALNVFLPHLITNPQGGHIVNTASLAGLRAFPGIGPYCVSKSGVVVLSETLALELARDHPTVGVTVL